MGTVGAVPNECFQPVLLNGLADCGNWVSFPQELLNMTLFCHVRGKT